MWLLKAEPDSRIVKGIDVKYTIDDLERDTTSAWEGVRNYQARNFFKEMRKGDLAFFYRSNCKQPAIVGLMVISKEYFPDTSASDPKHPYFDPKSRDPQKWDPHRWVTVEVKYLRHLDPILLSELKQMPKLQDMMLLKRSRLSISPVTDEQTKVILEMAGVSESEIEKLINERKSIDEEKSYDDKQNGS